MDFPPHLITALRNASSAAALTGAGISKESGIPTFREAQTGLWARYDPMELATPQAFADNPRLVWEWYAWRRELVSSAEPNPGHTALADMAQRIPEFHLITQNVDGLHTRAGSQEVIELHGNILRTICSRDRRIVETWSSKPIPPLCPDCGSPLRPDVVWFGENLALGVLESTFHAARSAQIFFSVGTSSLVQPAASLPEIAWQAGALLIEINPSRTPLTDMADFHLSGPSGEVLSNLVASVWPEKE